MKSADGKFIYLDDNYRPVPDGSLPHDVHRFGFECPKGVGGHYIYGLKDHHYCAGLNLRDRGHDIKNRSWHWDGNIDQPTIKPSVNCSRCPWHGFITKGEIKSV